MLLLVLFALLAGGATALSPCVLPVLPALLAASGTGGRRRPLGVVFGLSLTFFVTIAGLATVVNGVGLGDGTTRSIGIVVLAGFGVALAVPALAHLLQARLAVLSRLAPKDRGTGFASGIGVGAAFGFVYAPCAGPILAGVISVSAASGATAELLVVAAAYSAGTAAVLLAFALGGRRVLGARLNGARAATLQRAFGAVMVATAVGMAFDLDVRFQTALADDLPGFVSNPTRALERSDAVEKRLADLRGKSRFDSRRAPARKQAAITKEAAAPDLPVLGTAPDFTGNQRWFNTPGGRALSLSQLRGRVVLVDFWTYTCINCIRTLPYMRELHKRYAGAGLTIVGVHTPEFEFEKDAGNVVDAIAQSDLRYAVAQDNDFATWNAWGNQFWPAKYLIDAEGQVRYTHFGEGAYEETEAAVRALLREAGARELAAPDPVDVETASSGELTAETYLGTKRAERFLPGPPKNGTHRYGGFPVKELLRDNFALAGEWRANGESSTAGRGARLDARVRARQVFLVLSSRDNAPRHMQVLLDGRPVSAAEAGADVRDGVVTVRRQRLYRLVKQSRVRTRTLTLRPEPGISGFAFTFG